MKVLQFEEFQQKTKEMNQKNIKFTFKYQPQRLTLQVSNGIHTLQYQTDKLQDLNKLERFIHSFLK